MLMYQLYLPEVQFFIDGYHTPVELDQNRKSGVILLYVCENIPAQSASVMFLLLKASLLKLF